MTPEQLLKLKALKYRLDMTPAIYRGGPRSNDGWVMSNFTYEQFRGNLDEMRKLLNQVLSEESPDTTEQGSG